MKAVVFSMFGKFASAFGKLFSVVNRLIQKLWLLPPGKKIDGALQRSWKVGRPLQYHFLPYVTSVLRVIGWAVLVIGVIASILFGLEVMNYGLTIGGTKLIGIGMGVLVVVLGIVASFLAWLLVLVSRELICLFIHVKQNTGNTAACVTKELH